ncbi:hypothetical protein FSP39_000959 [Pinctada imbricata]|uniref:RNA-binding protein NOB1 n=1 Tax=Pinctada imbricata TaxID=66713 RepID=A0AA88XH58_PINIB|nr:hypothetical protein FSP39_000959 [Pinctada imbricata]
MDSNTMVKHVVADSGAFIRNAPLNSIGVNIYVVPEVISEIRDKATRQRLEVLPYKLIPKTPATENIKIVTEFAKKTGDYRSLSAVDMRVLALTYQLEKENMGTEHIKTNPNKQIEWNTTRQMLEKATDIAGFYLAKKNPSRSTSERTSTSEFCDSTENGKEELTSGPDSSNCEYDQQNHDMENVCTQSETDNKISVKSGTLNEENVKDELSNRDDIELSSSEDVIGGLSREGAILPSHLIHLEEEEEDEGIEEDDDEDDDDDDDEGWITPSNIQSVKKSMGDIQMEKASVTVGCVTTDFAMQNVLLQMGLNVISINGMLIKKAKSFVQRCFACMKVTTNMMIEFCPHCGNNTLQKVSMSLDDDGKIQCFLSRRKPMNTRGMKYSLPMPKGGKHAKNPVLVADQPLPQQRVSKKSRQKMDVLDVDYVASQSPFSVRDITSRAAQLGIRSKNQFNRRNPNENRKKSGKKK